MSLIEEELEKLLNWKIVAIMSDGKKFRGRLKRFDEKLLVIEEVYELSDKLQWIKPIIYTTVAKSSVESGSIVEESDRGYLDQVLLNIRHIIRIWPWEPKKFNK